MAVLNTFVLTIKLLNFQLFISGGTTNRGDGNLPWSLVCNLHIAICYFAVVHFVYRKINSKVPNLSPSFIDGHWSAVVYPGPKGRLSLQFLLFENKNSGIRLG